MQRESGEGEKAAILRDEPDCSASVCSSFCVEGSFKYVPASSSDFFESSYVWLGLLWGVDKWLCLVRGKWVWVRVLGCGRGCNEVVFGCVHLEVVVGGHSICFM